MAAQRPALCANLHRALAGEEFTVAVILGKHTFTTRYAPLRDEAGAIVGVVGVAANSRRRVRAEATVRRYEVGLSPHEQEALTLFATDLTHRQIAARLNTGYETVRTLLRRLATKLDLDTAARAAVIAAAREQNLLDGDSLNP